MSEEIAVVTPESGPAMIPPVEAPAVPTGTPRDNVAVTSEHLGHFEKPATALDENGRLSKAFTDGIKENLKAQRPDPDALPKALKKFKQTPDELAETLDLVEGIYEPTGKGIVKALDSVFDRDRDTFERIGFAIVSAAPALAIKHLVSLGHLPETIDQPQPREIPQDLAAMIPDHLREYAELLPSEALYQWANDGTLLGSIEMHGKTHKLWLEMKAQANEEEERAIARAKQDGNKALAELHDQYQTAHYEQLNKWKPTGDKDADATLRNMVFASGLDEILADPKWARIQLAMTIMHADAPLWRVLKGDHMTADSYEREARSLAERFNVRFGQIMKQKIQWLDQVVFKHRRKAEPKEEPQPPQYEFHPGEDGRLVRTVKGAK